MLLQTSNAENRGKRMTNLIPCPTCCGTGKINAARMIATREEKVDLRREHDDRVAAVAMFFRVKFNAEFEVIKKSENEKLIKQFDRRLRAHAGWFERICRESSKRVPTSKELQNAAGIAFKKVTRTTQLPIYLQALSRKLADGRDLRWLLPEIMSEAKERNA